ncbi:oligosaccharide flippase family protein [Loktanella salsilacus]|uniref:oligosaccharide flippase family protein n=1 Tax=Loktanella salsilacus TaxID=195913 RepID=UPI0030039396
MFRSALLILSGNATAALLLLARNLIVARMIPVADYGVAATFAIAMAVVEMASALGLQQQIVQARNGEDARFQAALQGFQVLRGVIAGIALFVCAGLIADALNVPQAAWAYRVMALVPVLNALVHFDIHRLNRTMVFWPMILTGAVPALLSVLAVWPLAAHFGDYRVMLYAIVVQAVATAAISHLVAHRPYRLVLDRAVMAQSLRFGWPLLVNGILLFGVFNGDKLIVGRELGMEVLAIFAMGFTLTLTPTLVMAKSVQNFFLPQLSAVDRSTRAGEAQFIHLAMASMQAIILMGAILMVSMALFAPAFVSLLLGEKYASLTPYLIWLAVMQAMRVTKAGPAIVALAGGQTANAMIANTLRIATLPLCWYVAVTTGNLLTIIIIGIAGEVLGHAVALAMIRARSAVPLRAMVLPQGAAVLVIIAAVTLAPAPLALQALVQAVLLGLMVWCSDDLRRHARRRPLVAQH